MPSSFTSVGISTAPEPGELGEGAFVLTFPLNVDLATGHYGIPKGATGRNGQTIIAICLHTLETTLETYKAYLASSLNVADIRPGQHGSVHYGVGADGTLHQFVEDSNTAWAIQDLSNPTWTLLNEHVGVDPNYYTLNIGVEKYISTQMPTLMFRGLADLVTLLVLRHEIPIDANHIISHAQLDDTFTDCDAALATNLIATVISLAAQGNTGVTLDLSVIAAQLAALETQVDTLSDNFDDALATINTYADHVTTKAGASTLGHIESSSTLAVNSSTGVATVTQNAAAAKVSSGTQTIVASIAAVVQFPTIISDALSWITAGVFQKVTPTIAGLYRIRTRIQFAAATWTAGKIIQLDVYKNGALLETMAYKTIEANLTSKIVDVAGECEFLHSTLTDYYQVVVTTDDANGSKTIASGNCFVERVGA